jgi:hypothetical protein
MIELVHQGLAHCVIPERQDDIGVNHTRELMALS